MAARLLGLEALQRKFRRLPQSLQQKYLVKATRAGGEIIREAARRKAPRGKTGKLQDTMALVVVHRSPTDARVRVGPSAEAWYGRLLEYGTIKMKARPFLRPAFDESQQAVLEVVSKAMQDAVDSINEALG